MLFGAILFTTVNHVSRATQWNPLLDIAMFLATALLMSHCAITAAVFVNDRQFHSDVRPHRH